MGAALVADALDKGMLLVVDLGLFQRSVVEEDLNAVGSGLLKAADAPVLKQVGEAAGGGGVVAGLFVGEQEARIVAFFRGGQAVLGVEQDRRGVAGKDAGDKALEPRQDHCRRR